VFRLAHVFYKAAIDTSAIDSAVALFKKARPHATDIPLFERQGGKLPSIREVDDTALDRQSEWFIDDLDDLMARECRAILQGECDELRETQRRLDLLVLVPSYGSHEHRWAADALSSIAGEDFLDYAVEENRRCRAHAESLRLCTFHSARGIEGDRVVVFGFESLERVAQQTSAPVRNLGYTVLSRARFECTIVRRKSQAKRPVMLFLSEAVAALKEQETAKHLQRAKKR